MPGSWLTSPYSQEGVLAGRMVGSGQMERKTGFEPAILTEL